METNTNENQDNINKESEKVNERREKYIGCSFYDEGKCGPYTRQKPIDEIVSPVDLTENVYPHLKLLHLIKENETNGIEWNERKLIESRVGRHLLDNEKLCSYHRYTNGVGWKQPRTCQHPDHPKEKGKKAASGRVASIKRAMELGIPVGSILCHKHRLQRDNVQVPTTSVLELELQPAVEDDAEEDDPTYVDSFVLISPEQANQSFEKGHEVAESLERTPRKYQLKRRLPEIETKTLKDLHSKMKKWEDSARKQFAAYVAPGQEEELLQAFVTLEDDDEEENELEVPAELKRLASLYENSDTLARMVILSTIDHEKYTKEKLMAIFKCSRYSVDQSRKWTNSFPGLSLPQKKNTAENVWT